MKRTKDIMTPDTKSRNKVYYGEYSIEHWLKLLLSGNIVLPDYQRYFVWEPKDVEALVDTIKADRFIPPITIGSYKDSTGRKNCIVDGQQRLTSILLAVLGWFPDKKKFEVDLFARERDEDEGTDAYGEQEESSGVMKWTCRELLRGSRMEIEDVENKCRESGNYIAMPKLARAYLKDRYIGFCYLVPDDVCGTVDYFANVFMDINANGIPLSPQESRRSLYFLTPGLEAFMEPRFLVDCGIVNNLVKNKNGGISSIEHIDFIKYLSIMNEYYARSRCGAVNMRKIAVNFKNRSESYYKTFIMVLSGREQADPRFCPQDSWAYKCDYKSAMDALRDAMAAIDLQRQFDSIADMDVAFFGLVYWVCYCGRKIDGAKKLKFAMELKKIFEGFRTEENYLKSSSHMGKLRRRIEQSVEFYRKFLING